MHAEDCFAGNFIGADFNIYEDLKEHLPETWKEFNKRYIPKWMKKALRKTLFKYKLHQDTDLFDRAFGYIREYY